MCLLIIQRAIMGICLENNHRTLPVNSRALYTECDAQVDAGPAGVRLATVAAAGIAWDGQDLLQGALSL